MSSIKKEYDLFDLAEKHIKRKEFLAAYQKALDIVSYFKYSTQISTIKPQLVELYNCIKKDKERCLRFSSENLLFLSYDDNDNVVSSKAFKCIKKLYDNFKYRNFLFYSYNSDFFCDFMFLVIGINNGYKFINKSLKVYKGDDITKAYSKFSGNVWSCMAGDKAIYTKLYSDNPSKVSLLVYNKFLSEDIDKTSTNTMSINAARALLWKADDGAFVLDRTYPTGYMEYMFVGWAISNGFLYKMPRTSLLSDRSARKITVKIPEVIVFPFVDTFYHGMVNKDMTMVLSNTHSPKRTIKLSSTDGNYRGKCSMFSNTCKCGYRYEFDLELKKWRCYRCNIDANFIKQKH